MNKLKPWTTPFQVEIFHSKRCVPLNYSIKKKRVDIAITRSESLIRVFYHSNHVEKSGNSLFYISQVPKRNMDFSCAKHWVNMKKRKILFPLPVFIGVSNIRCMVLFLEINIWFALWGSSPKRSEYEIWHKLVTLIWYMKQFCKVPKFFTV